MAECRENIVLIKPRKKYFSYTSLSAKLDIFSLICATDKVWIIELTLIHKKLGQFVTRMCKIRTDSDLDNYLILKIISQCDIKYILTSPIKNNNASFEDLDIHHP